MVQIGKGVHQGYILSPGLFNLNAEYIIQNAGLDDSQARIKIAKRNINNLRYVDDTTLMAKSEEELKTLLMKVKEESEKADVKLNIQKPRSWHQVPSVKFSLVQLLSHARLFVTPWTAACQASLSFTVSQSLLRLMSTESVKPSNHLVLCCHLLLPSIFPSIRVFFQ